MCKCVFIYKKNISKRFEAKKSRERTDNVARLLLLLKRRGQKGGRPNEERFFMGRHDEKKRRTGGERTRDSLLWDLIANEDDICFTHILPRLNRTDVKFLYLVNSETRKLIKRSSRKGEFKKEV